MNDDHSVLFQNGKLAYERPQLTRIGTLESITQHASTGHALDVGFGAGTLASDLTFSD
jgi:hypothetical protein